MRIALALFAALIPIQAVAINYECRGKREKALLEASSKAEAEYKFRQQYPRATFLECSSEKIDPDIFVRNPFFRTNRHIRPYMPSDLKGDWEAQTNKTYSVKEKFTCNHAGEFSPDSDREIGSCAELRSISAGASFRIRYGLRQRNHSSVGPGGVIRIWKLDGGGWKPWVEFQHVTGYPVVNVSAEAQRYAAVRGAATPVDAGTANKSSPAPPAPSNEKPSDNSQATQNAAKDATTKVLKGLLGR